MTVEVRRDAGHPWSAAAGWDQLSLKAETVEALDAMISNAESKRWRVWIRDQRRSVALMYKPSGATAAWEDEPRHGTPTEKCRAIQVGDEVYTDFGGSPSRHRVTERKESINCQTGIMLRVTPAPRGSSYVKDDPGGSPYREAGGAWLSAAWFRPAA